MSSRKKAFAAVAFLLVLATGLAACAGPGPGPGPKAQDEHWFEYPYIGGGQ